MTGDLLRIVILVGGRGCGSNMQAIIDACADGRIAGVIAGVISTNQAAPALLRASEQGIATAVVPFDKDPVAYERALLPVITSFNPGLIVLAGFLKRLGPGIVNAFMGRIMNIHPALIPSFCGPGMFGERVHQAAIDYGVRYSGCTVHFVDEDYDTGPVIMQSVVPVEQDDVPLTLASRVLKEEHRIYPECVKLFAEGRLRLEGRRVRILP